MALDEHWRWNGAKLGSITLVTCMPALISGKFLGDQSSWERTAPKKKLLRGNISYELLPKSHVLLRALISQEKIHGRSWLLE